MPARHWSLRVSLAVLVVAGTATMISKDVAATGRTIDSMVRIRKVMMNGIAVSFTASGALASARSDASGAGLEEIGCWTVDGQSINCLAADASGSQAACIVADSVTVNGVKVSLGYVMRLAALNGDSFIRFAGVADDPNDPLTSYSCTSLQVENRSIYSPKQ